MKDATFAQAAAAPSRAAGIPVRIPPAARRPGEPEPPLPPELNERASFDWRETTFARALRELCRHYGLRPWFAGDEGYHLTPDPGGLDPAGVLGAAAEEAGFRIFVSAITRHHAAPALRGEANARLGNTASVTLDCDAGEGDARRIYGIANLRARDDRGALLTVDRPSAFPSREYPDRWAVQKTFRGLHPEAARLEWITGDLLVRRHSERFRIEVPLPAVGGTVRVKERGVEAVVFRVPAAPGERPGGVRVRCRVEVPAGLGRTAGEGVEPPRLEGEPGTVYPARARPLEESRGARGETYVFELAGEAPGEPSTRIVLPVVLMSPPEKLFSFRLTGIPLPPPPRAP